MRFFRKLMYKKYVPYAQLVEDKLSKGEWGNTCRIRVNPDEKIEGVRFDLVGCPLASTLSWKGEPLPFMPFVYPHPEYWQKIQKETKGSGDFIRSSKLFMDSEKARPHTEEEMIKIENIHGKLILVGADDDGLWEAGKYVRRMDERLKSRPHNCEYEAVAYKYGTHFVLPEGLLRIALPVGLKFVLRFMFRSAKEHPDECEETRKDIDRRFSKAIRNWIEES